ncbi:MAG: M48 family metallopeptidase [Candidatus Omnitrophica bacterium]|nr:M48 family metallopeptidase [Candidatus Omnitrophota bacterium]
MNLSLLTIWAALVLIIVRGGAEAWLEWLNRREARDHAASVPDVFRDFIDAPTYAKSVQYTLAKTRLNQVEAVWQMGLLIAVLFSGLLPWAFHQFDRGLGNSAWSMAAYLFVVGVVLAVAALPLDWYAQFRLEQRFGFNTTTPRTWWSDRLKGLLLGAALGYPLLVLILKLVDWIGTWWWVWAWGCVVAFQLLMAVLAPVLILPLFNKMTPLQTGPLRDRLLALAQRTGFRTKAIQVMDGSRRSRHSNAFFTGFGRFRKIVLFDTLVAQLADAELEAVLAHEIGHYQKRHVVKLLIGSAAGLLLGFGCVAWLARQAWFYRAFGFSTGSIVPALLLAGLLSGVIGFWLSPLIHYWSRRFEYQADAYSAKITGQPESLVRALRGLSEKNLSNLTPHPLYSRFFYSHPTLLERQQALRAMGNGLRAKG